MNSATDRTAAVNGAYKQFSLCGKTALIAGGHGLYGDALAKAFAHAGVRTYIAARDMAALNHLEQDSPNIIPLYLDLGSKDSIDTLADKFRIGKINVDILINNAVARTMHIFDDTWESFAKSMDINATGLFYLTRQIGNQMKAQRKGSIVNIGSIQGMVGPDASLYEGLDMTGFIPDYFFHKSGMMNLTRFMASYYGPFGIRCNCVCPGGVFSEKLPAEFVQRYNQRTMLGRMARPEDIVGITMFLASDASEYITGTNIPVDGGYTAK